MKEIIKLVADKELDMTKIMIRVPNFQNFGQGLGELERKSFEALMEAPPDLEKLSHTMAEMSALTEQLLQSIPEGQRQMIQQMMKEIDEDDTIGGENDEEDDIDQGENPESFFQYDLQQLTVSIPPNMKWDRAAEAVVDQFLANWPKVRTAVLEATADYYKEQYPDVLQFMGNVPGAEITLPKPDGPEVVADLFRISTIYLREDGGIGLSGHCTWDDEHGYGVLLKDGKIAMVGQASDAFDTN